ncbi:MAG: VOC family protein [Opitutaceae bacterium]|nr:VOC family protein [Opitutaceae bacterium]
MPSINHIELRVASVDESEKFYDPLCEYLGYEKHHRMKASILYRSKEGIGDLILVRTRKAGHGKSYDKEAPGFAHLAWNAGSRQEVDSLYELLLKTNAVVLDAPCEMTYSPGYYAVWFQDPDGMKLEYAFTPMQNPTIQEEFRRLKAKTASKKK